MAFAYSWGTSQSDSPPWLDRAKMASLGFDVGRADSALDDRRSFGRDVLLVLEFDGPAYQRSLVNAAEFAARHRLKAEPIEEIA